MVDHYTPSGRGPQLIAVYSFFLAITTLITALRVYARAYVIKGFGLDDWTASLGWLLFVLHSAFAIAGAYHGTGQHAHLILPPENLPIALRDWWTCEPLYAVSNMAVKLSIGLMLLRLIVEPSQKLVIFIVLGVLQVYSIAYFFLFIFQCSPPSFFWTRMQGATNGTCMDPAVVINATYVYSAITVIVDSSFALLPWFVVRGLQMNQRTKLAVAVILALGSIASAATIVRIPYISNMSNTADFLYATTDVAIWSCAETGLSITASSAATLKPLFKTFLSRSRLFGATTRPSRTTSNAWPSRAKGPYLRSESRDTRTGTEAGSERNILKTFQVDVQHVQRE